jgi:uncharacterized protein YkwD
VNRLFFLLFSILVVAASAAFPQTSKPVAVRWIVGETGGSVNSPVIPRADRPRVVGHPTEGVKASVAVNIQSAEHLAFDMINQKRAAAGLKLLVWSDKLEGMARGHSYDMATKEYFSHRDQAGKMVSDRADDAHVGNWRSIGENIAFNRGYDDPVGRAIELWMNSPSHRTNLLSDSWKESAVGVAVAADGSYYFTQVFLKR